MTIKKKKNLREVFIKIINASNSFNLLIMKLVLKITIITTIWLTKSLGLHGVSPSKFHFPMIITKWEMGFFSLFNSNPMSLLLGFEKHGPFVMYPSGIRVCLAQGHLIAATARHRVRNQGLQYFLQTWGYV